jgi:hypothetical protein
MWRYILVSSASSGRLAGSCKYVSERMVSIKGRECTDHMTDYPLHMNSVPRRPSYCNQTTYYLCRRNLRETRNWPTVEQFVSDYSVPYVKNASKQAIKFEKLLCPGRKVLLEKLAQLVKKPIRHYRYHKSQILGLVVSQKHLVHILTVLRLK